MCAVLWLASVLYRCLVNIGVLIYLFGGLRMGPQSLQNCPQPVLLRLTIYLRLKYMVLMSPIILMVVR